MRIEHTVNSHDKLGYKQSFQAIKVPLKKGNYDAMLEAVYSVSPFEKIELKRGQTKAGKIIDYVMTKFGSEKENRILELLKTKLNSNISVVKDKSVAKNTRRYYEPIASRLLGPLDNSTRIFGVDADPNSADARDFIWSCLLEKVEEKERFGGGRLSEYNLKKLMESLASKESNIDDEKMYEIVDKFRIYNGQCVQKNGYIGQMLRFKQDALPELKAAGIKTIINLEYFDEDFERACHDAGLEHIYLNVSNPYEDSYVFRPKKDFFKRCKTPEQLQRAQKVYENTIKKEAENIIKIIETINKGNYYMGCNMCHERTPQALSFNRYFNPKDKTAGMGVELYYSFKEVKNLYTHFTEADKKRLGYTPEFIKRFED